MKKLTGDFEDFNGNIYDVYEISIDLLFAGEDMSKKETPKSIDDYPITIYADGEIQDGHHRFKYMLENGYKTVRVILAQDIDEDYDIDESEYLDGLFDTIWMS